MPEEIPDWVSETPFEADYQLVMFDGCGGTGQAVDITRDEYIALKRHLAAMRGYGLATGITTRFMEFCKAPPDSYDCCDTQQSARHILTARDVYRHSPDLVVTESADLAEFIEKLADDDYPTLLVSNSAQVIKFLETLAAAK